AIDLIGKLFRKARVADFVGIEAASIFARRPERGPLHSRIGKQLQQNMACRYGPRTASLASRSDKHLPARQPIGGQITVSQSSRRVRIIEKNKPPASLGWPGAFRNKHDLCINSPRRSKISVYLDLQGRHGDLRLFVVYEGTFVNYGQTVRHR